MIDILTIPECPKGCNREEFYFKYSSASTHFIERLNERYGIKITVDDYNSLLENGKYQGWYSKNASNSLGMLLVNDVKVMVLYSRRFGLYTTVYPAGIENSVEQLIVACFARPVRNVAYELYELIKYEIDKDKGNFDTIKDAAIHYFSKCNYPTLLIDLYKYGKIRPLMVCNEISKIIDGTHKRVSISVRYNPKKCHQTSNKDNGGTLQHNGRDFTVNEPDSRKMS